LRLKLGRSAGEKRLPEFLAGAFVFPVMNMRAPGAGAATPEFHVLDSRAEEMGHATADNVPREV